MEPCLFGLLFYSSVNIYGHVEMVHKNRISYLVNKYYVHVFLWNPLTFQNDSNTFQAIPGQQIDGSLFNQCFHEEKRKHSSPDMV